jgi:ADP-heptose:LPS heptosyltransferase
MMKILVIQVGSVGDLLLTLPSLKGLKRSRPATQVHILVQDEYCQFMRDSKLTDKVYSSVGVSAELSAMINEGYSAVINLSTNAAAADLTFILSEKHGALSSGYSRYEDGSLKISDDASGYIYAQSGASKSGRLHIVDLVSSLCSVDLIADDYNFDDVIKSFKQATVTANQKSPSVLVQVGNLSKARSHTMRSWKLALLKLAAHYKGDIAFVGGLEHRADAAYLMGHLKSKRFKNLTGKLTIEQVLVLASDANCLISCGDVLSQVATISNTRCLELASGGTNFWESGPLSNGSVVVTRNNESVTDEQVANAVVNFVRSGNVTGPSYSINENVTDGDYARFSSTDSSDEATDGFIEWSLIKALYLPNDFPVIKDPVFQSALEKLVEANQVAAEQVSQLNTLNAKSLGQVIMLFDDVAKAVAQMCPTIRPLNDWFFAERTRIQAANFELIKAQTNELHKKFELVCGALINIAMDRSEERGSSQDNDIQL